MNKEVLDALKNFVVRVAKGGATSDKEIEILPEIAMIVLERTRSL